MALDNDIMPYMGHHWIQIQGDIVVIGINEDALDEIEKIQAINLPSEGETVDADNSCGDIDTTDGTLGIYSPINGTVTEINNDIAKNPELIFEDPYEEGWLIKIEATDSSEIDSLLSKNTEEN